jgi:hypothetical protein
LAFATVGLGGATILLYATGEKQFRFAIRSAIKQSRDMRDSIKAATDSAKAANRSAKVAEEALVSSDRAWISIKPEIIGNFVIEKDRIQIGVGFNLTNIGKSPATNVQVWAEICPDIVDARERGRKAAETFRFNLMDTGFVLFPEEIEHRDFLEMEMPTSIFKARIAEDMTSAKERGDDEAEWSTMLPAIMACVSYRLAGSRKVRHTVILYEVRSLGSGHLGWDGSEMTVSLATLKLVQTFMSGQVT